MKLKALQNHNSIVVELMKRFNIETCVLVVNEKRLKLTKVKVSHVVGFPIGVDVHYINCKIGEMCIKYGFKLGSILRKYFVVDLKSMEPYDK